MAGLFTGKALLAGGSVVALGTGDIIVYTQKPEWLGMEKEKSINGEQAPKNTPEWITVLGLPDECKNSGNRTCKLTGTKIKTLGFVFGNDNKSENVHVKQSDETKTVTLKWKEITGEQNMFSFGLMFSIVSDKDNLEILKTNNSSQDGEKITLSTTEVEFKLIEDGGKYYFKKMEQSDREQNANMNCNNNDNSCTLIANAGNINGLNSGVEVTKLSAKDSNKYKVSTESFTEEDGYYKLIFDETAKKWKLTKVEDLFTKWDKSVLTTGNWSTNKDNQNPKSIKVTVNSTDSKINGNASGTNWTWECEIKAKDSENDKTFDLTKQFSDLETKLGIANPQSPPTNNVIKKQRKVFVENCANNRSSDQTTKLNGNDLTSVSHRVQSSMTLDVENEGNEEKRKFKAETFEKLFKEKVESIT